MSTEIFLCPNLISSEFEGSEMKNYYSNQIPPAL